ncbi:hypothetical protein, unlikely [Trypanosoma brucei gambiense DAL972]|uniref:T. brucei spp.-specific protein n=1 Tax=Trypanosoma brucei gambiense (strain MHOM/CI/86/DAL972) TaxID=679716 RepID=D0A7M8_TRYB9|nr:hypothetical protein, unlikely [Trypanosoma brucei gambiense DAL972]CBH17679.1 hypothetical protein, unlikely [Trypanosoma brucei gambiense DAL972]|eukprot:XP_011779943.1 hypothetical protein, unlikely [Trypanosoma brucei gambiense DAL972]
MQMSFRYLFRFLCFFFSIFPHALQCLQFFSCTLFSGVKNQQWNRVMNKGEVRRIVHTTQKAIRPSHGNKLRVAVCALSLWFLDQQVGTPEILSLIWVIMLPFPSLSFFLLFSKQNSCHLPTCFLHTKAYVYR